MGLRAAVVVRFTVLGLATACADSPVTPPTQNPQSALPITQLQFRVQPTESYAGAPIAPAIEVEALTSDGTVASWFNGEITLSVDDGTAGSEGTMTVRASAGVAQFGDVSVDHPGRGFTWRAKTGQITAQSLPFDVASTPRVAFSACLGWVAASGGRACTASGISVLGADGSVSTLSASPGGYAWDPAWSPDGKYIAVTATLDCEWWQDRCDTDLYLISLEDGTESRLTHGEYSSVELPSWSPDGQLIAFSAVRQGEHRAETIYTMRRDGSNIVPLGGLFGVYGTGVVWSPDGNRIAFTVAGTEIWVADTDGSHARKITEGWHDSYPAWSPDGRQIAFTRAVIRPNDYADCQLFLTNPEGSPSVQLTHDAYCVGGPAWSPDGTKILYYGNPSFGILGLIVINADGSGTKMLRRDAGFESRPAWAPASAGQPNRRLPPP